MTAPRMASHEPDFEALYRDLGITAHCALPAFKQRYRRRVAQLHPDRAGSARDPEALKALNLRYSAALAFHRRHGRLPDAVGAAGAWTGAGDTAMAALARAPRRVPRARAAFAVLAALAAGAWTVSTWTAADPATGAGGPAPAAPAGVEAPPFAPAQAAPDARDPASPRLHPGMDASAVRALLGEPIGRGDDDRLWVYGPSWLRFECGRLVAWYSSPLAPLKIPVVDDPHAAAHPARRCVQAAHGDAGADAGLPAGLAGAAR